MNKTIRQTLTVLISLTVLFPILVMSTGIFISIQRGIYNTVIQRNEVLAKSIALSIEQQIGDASALLINATANLGPFVGPEYKEILEASLVTSGIYESVFAIDEQGRVLYSIPQDEQVEGFDFSRHSVIRQVISGNAPGPVYSPVFISTLTKNPTIIAKK